MLIGSELGGDWPTGLPETKQIQQQNTLKIVVNFCENGVPRSVQTMPLVCTGSSTATPDVHVVS